MTFEGVVGGDMECWCLFADENTYKQICGEQAWKLEKEIIEELQESGLKIRKTLEKALGKESGSWSWRLYPNDFVKAKSGQKVRITIKTEILEE